MRPRARHQRGLDITWRRFTDDLAAGLGAARVRWSLPCRLANAIAFSLEHCYRPLRRTTGLSTRPLLSRQAVHAMGVDQTFGDNTAQELLGWEPRVDYADGPPISLRVRSRGPRGEARACPARRRMTQRGG
jgi:hypothetical protein